MQGPGENPPRRRAGSTSAPSGSPEENLKDWQRNTTWIGPIPTDADPFDEPADSPELQDVRSENVRKHSGDFWNQKQNTGYQYSLTQGQKPKKNLAAEPRKKERRISLRAAGILAAMLIAAAGILYFAVFRVREIRVVGNRDISEQDVIRFSGIRKGTSILRLSEKETEERLNSAAVSAAAAEKNYNYYRLEFRYLEKELPDRITIAVREREACCWLTWCGIMYVMDKSGLVLYETEDPAVVPANLVEVKGLEIRAGAQAGQRMVMASTLQESVFQDLFMEMKVLDCTGQIEEVDLSNTSSILITTRDPFTVALGNRDSIHAKLRSMLLVVEKLREMGKSGGSINMSDPETPVYSPASPT